MKTKDIVIVCDYHSENLQILLFNRATGEARSLKLPTSASSILQVLGEAESQLPPEGLPGSKDSSACGVVWIMEATTGWVRVKNLVEGRAEFLVVNVAQLPLPPKAKRRKTDKLDNQRVLREYLQGTLPLAHQPEASLRGERRLVMQRDDMVRRCGCLRSKIKAHLSHERWDLPRYVWSAKGLKEVESLAAGMGLEDRVSLEMKIEELRWQMKQIEKVEGELLRLYQASEAAQRVDQIRGIAEVGAISIVLRIGPICRFRRAEELIAFAGLCPGVHASDGASRRQSVGGPGTDKLLRKYLIEAVTWARQIPRYAASHGRALKAHGKGVARVVVARKVLRSIYWMLKTGERFNPAVV